MSPPGTSATPAEQSEPRKRSGLALVIAIAATVLVVVALDRQPYGYYRLLRVFLCAATAFPMLKFWSQMSDGLRFSLAALAAVYNPIVPIHLGRKDLWTIINLGSLLPLWTVATRRWHQ